MHRFDRSIIYRYRRVPRSSARPCPSPTSRTSGFNVLSTASATFRLKLLAVTGLIRMCLPHHCDVVFDVTGTVSTPAEPGVATKSRVTADAAYQEKIDDYASRWLIPKGQFIPIPLEPTGAPSLPSLVSSEGRKGQAVWLHAAAVQVSGAVDGKGSGSGPRVRHVCHRAPTLLVFVAS